MVRRGFTLTELLILLALTALLMSMLAPALSLGRKQAIAVECASNLHQLGKEHVAVQTFRTNGGWGTSPYDFESRESRRRGQGDHGGDGKGPNRFEQGDPTRAKDGYRKNTRSDSEAPFDPLLEAQSKDQPPAWTLVCPVAERRGENSYGITKHARLKPFERVSGSDELIFGCSLHKVVISLESFDYRHLDRANLLFGDLHVEGLGPTNFTNVMKTQMNR